MGSPADILDVALKNASAHLAEPLINDPGIVERVEYVARNKQNRAGVRLLMAGLLAKAHRPNIDIRKPYTEIGGPDSYSGRTYDESYITSFIIAHDLPCNPTTAFLTPALRNRNTTLTPGLNLVGRPPEVYEKALQLLTDVQTNKVSAEALLAETVRNLIVYRNQRRTRMEALLKGMVISEGVLPLSAEGIVTLIQQHIASPHSSRLPVLVVAAIYKVAQKYLGERILPLHGHNVADKQSGALGDLEITLLDEDNVVTSYEMKTRRVTRNDIDHALKKLSEHNAKVDNYIFITTEIIDRDVSDYAKSVYETTGGIEIAVLDCIGFLRHFLHLFYRLRLQFLDAYQELLLAEPESAVRQELKESFLALRQAAESAG